MSECASEVEHGSDGRVKWKIYRAHCEASTVTMKSRFDNEGRVILEGLGGEEATVRSGTWGDISYAQPVLISSMQQCIKLRRNCAELADVRQDSS